MYLPTKKGLQLLQLQPFFDVPRYPEVSGNPSRPERQNRKTVCYPNSSGYPALLSAGRISAGYSSPANGSKGTAMPVSGRDNPPDRNEGTIRARHAKDDSAEHGNTPHIPATNASSAPRSAAIGSEARGMRDSSASRGGSGTAAPVTGEITSPNLAGCAVER